MRYIAVLLTVHNRKNKTLKCLQNLYSQELADGYSFDVWLTDDGCTDGTTKAITEFYPKVHIVRGDGNLFWNRGMHIAWEAAAAYHDYDFYLWLNDDTFFFFVTVSLMLSLSKETDYKSVIVGSIKSSINGNTTYGGHDKFGLMSPDGTLRECKTFNGNCVLIPQYVYKQIGNLDWAYHHAIGDLDYGYRVGRAGLKSYITPKYVGSCELNSKLPAWARKEVPLRLRIKNLYSPLGYAEPRAYFHFDRKNFGLISAIKHFITIHVRLLFPQLWNK